MTPRAGEIPQKTAFPPFHPETTVRDLGEGQKLQISHLLSHIGVLGATGSGKSSGSGKFLFTGLLKNAQAGMLVLCPKITDPAEYTAWCEEAGRGEHVKVIDASGERYRFNFLNWIGSFGAEGAGMTLNVVALLEEIISALEPEKPTGGGENVFWQDSLHQLLIAVVDLIQLAEYELNLLTLRDIVRSAPLSLQQADDPKWQEKSVCWKFLEDARERCERADAEMQADYEECRAYLLRDFANLSDRTRSVITLMCSKLVQPFCSRPLRKLFSTDTTITPEETFDGAVLIVGLPIQEFRTIGKMCAVVFKYCWQVAVMRRKPAPPGEYLRPVVCWADEFADNFLSLSDSTFVACARQSAGALICLSQNVSQYRKRLGGEDAFETFISNLQTLFIHQSTGPTCRWMSERLGEQWVKVSGFTTNQSGTGALFAPPTSSNGTNVSEQRRFFVEPAAFTTLKRGGPAYGFQVEAILYMGGHIFEDGLPYKRLLFRQR